MSEADEPKCEAAEEAAEPADDARPVLEKTESEFVEAPVDGAGETVETCVNCDAALNGPYCHGCGQIARSRIKPFRELVVEVAGDTFAYDSRIWRTLKRLIISPGFLSCEYVLGRRVRYTPPFRLYLVVSLLVFVTLSFMLESMAFTAEGAAEPQETLPEPPELEGDETWFERQQIRFQRNATLMGNDPGPMLRNLVGMLPQMMFVLLPVLALIATPFYRSSRRYYIEHVIFMMHAHAFVFLIFLLEVALSGLRNGEFVLYQASSTTVVQWVSMGLWLWAFLYVLAAMKRFYAEGWIKTAVKYAAMTGLYIFLLGMALSIVAVLAIWAM